MEAVRGMVWIFSGIAQYIYFLSYFIKLNKLKEKIYGNNIIVFIKDNIIVSHFGSCIPSHSFSLVSLMFLLRLLIKFTSIGIFPLVYTMYINRK